MFNFAANLGFIFPQCPFLDRFSAAARAGFQRCEFLFPYYFKPEEIGTKLSASELMQALFNLPPGNWDVGRGDSRHCLAGKRFLQPQLSAP